MTPARIFLNTRRTLGSISPLLFGGFAEHMGRCVYGGIYDPGSPLADEHGLRRDVLAALREMGVSTVRYPGGNFLSGYDWRDGVGPREQRPVRRELAWQSLEPNQFGTDEFIHFCRQLGAEPMLAVNLGTGTIADAAALVEYCNAPTGSAYADMRAANGSPEPYNVRYWCLGNEMDGPWQIGHLSAEEYARKAREAAKMMRWQDPTVKLVLCGSSNAFMPTYPEWDRLALETCWEHVDYLSMHFYTNNRENDTASYLGMATIFEAHLQVLEGTLRYVKSKLRSTHDVFLSWDEWNVWYNAVPNRGDWQVGPRLSEEAYNLEDALVVAQWLNVFLRHCNLLKIACIAQIVNTIAPLQTEADGLLKKTTFYPFALMSRYARGLALDVLTQAPRVETTRFGTMPTLDVSASYDPATGTGAVFIVNRSLTDAVATELVWENGPAPQVSASYQLTGSDPKAFNSFAQPDLVVPRPVSGISVVGEKITLELPALSFTVLALEGMG